MTRDLKGGHHYEIKICGHLSRRRAKVFEGFVVKQIPEGYTILYGLDIDQSALFGVLILIRDLGIPLHSVNRIEWGSSENRQK